MIQVNINTIFNNTIISLGESIYSGKISILEVDMDQTNLLKNMKKGKGKKRNTFNNVSALYEGPELTLNALGSGTFSIKEKQEKQEKGLKILTPKQMLERLPIDFAQVKAGNTSESVLNKIRRIIYSLDRAK